MKSKTDVSLCNLLKHMEYDVAKKNVFVIYIQTITQDFKKQNSVWYFASYSGDEKMMSKTQFSKEFQLHDIQQIPSEGNDKYFRDAKIKEFLINQMNFCFTEGIVQL